MPDHHDLQPDDLPELSRDLRELTGPPADIPADLDVQMRGRIRAHFANPRRVQPDFARRIAPYAAAAAAVIALAVWLASPHSSAPPTPPRATAEPADVDRNGRVDILDAYALARRLEEGVSIDSTFDLNRDGVIDGSDVDRIAARAVSLNQGAG